MIQINEELLKEVSEIIFHCISGAVYKIIGDSIASINENRDAIYIRYKNSKEMAMIYKNNVELVQLMIKGEQQQ